MLKPVAVLMLAIGIAACAPISPAERSARMQKEVDEMIVVYGRACERLGYKADSDPWRDCVLRLNSNKTIEEFNSRPTTTTCWGHRGFYNCVGYR
jgi:hypothetical protein